MFKGYLKRINILWYFYRKLLFPSLILSLFLSFWFWNGQEVFKGAGIALMLLTPAIQYLLYDFSNPKPYYFYYNLGFQKWQLWLFSFIFSALIGTLMMQISWSYT